MSDPFTPHLREGEHIIWSTTISERLVRSEQARQRLIALGIFVPSTLVTLLLTAVFLGSIAPRDAINPDAMLAPVYFAFALAIGILAIAQLFKLARPKQPMATHYAATPARLIALDASGAIVAEMAAGDVGDILAGGPNLDLAVLHRDEQGSAFQIRCIERPLEAKAILEDAYPAPPVEDPAAPATET